MLLVVTPQVLPLARRREGHCWTCRRLRWSARIMARRLFQDFVSMRLQCFCLAERLDALSEHIESTATMRVRMEYMGAHAWRGPVGAVRRWQEDGKTQRCIFGMDLKLGLGSWNLNTQARGNVYGRRSAVLLRSATNIFDRASWRCGAHSA